MTGGHTGSDEAPPLTVRLAAPRGFCAGVERAIAIVETALARYGAPVYVRHQIVHNQRVVRDLQAQGAVFVEELDQVPHGAVTVFSAHGVARRVERAAASSGLQVIDATCPLVRKVHTQGQRYADRGLDIVLIGHAGHAEVEGTLGQIDGRVFLVQSVADVAALAPRDPERLAYVTQTTLSVDDTRAIIAALRARFPQIQGPDTRDICYATQNRQTAVRELVALSDFVLVVGAPNSSNSNRLREIAEAAGCPARLVADAGQFDPAWLDGVRELGITAGASAPEVLIDELVAELRRHRRVHLTEMTGVAERVQFAMPADLVEA
jgi:4-hydroxy-3-methylbut-2-enyl diphosphate reductase